MVKRMGRTGQGGFSMIEVLVASAILTVLVMMLGMLFQQSSLAWRAGSKRAEGYMQLRSLVGALQRDATDAVDVEGVKRMRKLIDSSDSLSLQEQRFNGGEVLFYTLAGTNRALTKVTYDSNGNRKEDVLDARSGSWKAGQTRNVMASIKNQSSKESAKLESISFDAKFDGSSSYGSGSRGLPLYMTVEAKISATGYTLDIGAASAGPDKQWGTKDDITTWAER